MASTLEITCPDCEKGMNLPADMAGKKVRCKACGHVFRVEASGPGGKVQAKSVKAKPDPKAKPKPDPKAKPKPKNLDDDDDPNPYGLTEEYLGPRCPHCATAMEEEDIICLHCGYNTQKRERTATRKVFERTGLDWFLWLFPAIMCVIIILMLVGGDIWYVMKVPTEADNEDFLKWALFHKGVKLWVVIATLFAIFFCARFAFKRLIFHPLPPEREKQDFRNIWMILGAMTLGILLFLGTTAFAILIVLDGGIPNPWFFAPLYSTAIGMIAGPLQYNV
jgi:ribosomal protein S27E